MLLSQGKDLFPKGKKDTSRGKKSTSPRGNINFPGVKATSKWKTLLSFGGNATSLGGKLLQEKKETSQGGARRKSVSVTALNDKD